MECPKCGEELNYDTYYYAGNYEMYIKGYADSGFEKLGDIYQCCNEDCESCGESFHTEEGSDELHEGYPL